MNPTRSGVLVELEDEMKRVSMLTKWHGIKDKILEDWIDVIFIIHKLVKNVFLALAFNVILLVIRMLFGFFGQQWFSEVIGFIHEIASLLIFICMTIIDVLKFLKTHIPSQNNLSD